MSNVKAALKVVLMAEQVVVAESDDAQLWQRVLAAIQGGGGKLGGKQAPAEDEGDDDSEEEALVEKKGKRSKAADSPVVRFAADIGVSVEEVQGACDPSAEAPYLILDHDAWAEFKSQLGDRGTHAVSPIVVAATLLALWFKTANGQTNATQAQSQAVLKGINVRDGNPTRGIKRAEWVQPRAGGQIIINPTKMAKAKLFAKCFCQQDWSAWKAQ